MPMDYTVIQAVRQRFGASDLGGPPGEAAVFGNAPFVGRSKEFHFDCPSVSPDDMAVLQFTSVGIDVDDRAGRSPSTLRINGVDVAGGLHVGPASERYPLWTTQLLLVPQVTLAEHRNVLFIEAAHAPAFINEYVDSFVIDNVVIFYKTRVSDRTHGGPPNVVLG